MNQNKDLKEIIQKVERVVQSIREYEHYDENKEILNKFIQTYENLHRALIENNMYNIRYFYDEKYNFGRAFLETSSDWGAPFLYEMSDLGKMMKEYFS